jgi:hypothetical protein
MKELLELLRGINDELDKLDGRQAHRGGLTTSSDNTRGDSAEQIAAALRRRKIVREL